MRLPVRITLIDSTGENEIETYTHEYDNLMELILDRIYVDDFGACGGMGKCGTCVITTTDLKGKANEQIRNETTTLLRNGYDTSVYRLACQIMIDEHINEAVFTLVES